MRQPLPQASIKLDRSEENRDDEEMTPEASAVTHLAELSTMTERDDDSTTALEALEGLEARLTATVQQTETLMASGS